jgi:predicted AlkP superfamily pyrophosphatase or phosphodiesterase
MKKIITRKVQIVSLLTVLLLGAASSIYGQPKPIRDLKPTIILVSLDGFRYDYLAKYKPEHLSFLARKGVRAKWLIPSFPVLLY